MIHIKDNKLNLDIYFDGSIKEISSKKGYTKITSTRGVDFTEHIRGVINLQITIDYLTKEDYEKLKLMFFNSSSGLLINEDTTSKTYSNYYIDGETLSLDSYEDYINKIYYYKGGISLNKQ